MIVQDLFEAPQLCPECGGISFSDLILAEKKDACYYKVKASAKVWPSAYASGRLVQCRKKGADNYGNSKNEGVAEGLAQDESEQSHGWVADSIDEINYNTFEVHLTNTRSGESADLVIRPVDMMRISGKLQIETIDVRDLATGDTQSWTTEMPDPQGAIVDAIDALFWDNPQLNKKLYAIIDAHSKKGQDMLSGQKNRAKVGMAAPADQFIAGQDAIAKAKGTVKEFDAQGFQQRYTLYKDGYEIEKFGDIDDAIEYAEDDRRDGDDPLAVYKIVDINKQVVWDSNPYEKPSRIQLRKPEQGVAEAKSPAEFIGQMKKLASTEQQFNVGDWVTIDPNETSGYASSGMIGRIIELYDDEGESMAKIAVGGSSGVQKKLGKGVRSSGTHTVVPTSILQKDDPQGVAEGDDNFGKPAAMMRPSAAAAKTAQDILQKQADQNVIGMAKVAGAVPAQGVAEVNNEKIGGRYDPEEFDSMVQRLKKLAGVGPMKTVYDPQKRVYRNMPVAQQPDKK